MSNQKSKKSLPHTQAIQKDRSKRSNSLPTDEQIAQWMEEVIHPAVYAQMSTYNAMGLRARTIPHAPTHHLPKIDAEVI